jgi:hypothetical protein
MHQQNIMNNFINEIANQLKSKSLTISTCEFYTSGLIASILSKNNTQFSGGLILKTSLIPLFFNAKQISNFDIHSINVNNFLALQTANKFKTDLSVCVGELHENKVILSICVIDKTFHKEISVKDSASEQLQLDVCYQTLVELSRVLRK